ncbi:hypothetical protein [Bailinhaonella thermotolerans]|uniref:hypothetical protein n=1 Tax=Bailinhaonella thermotolerans TaxID=1070861 RepID=UPI001F5B8828|nr:hypothetical protein [Bailinhaonella thermotolerans]
MRFPSRLFAAQAWFAAMAWLVLAGVIAVIVLAVVLAAGPPRQSVWEQASQVPRWFTLFVGVFMVREYLPLYIAHGQTRRRFTGHLALTVLAYAPYAAALVTLGFLLEALVYAAAGWPQALDRAHLYSSPTQVHLVFAEYLVEILAWTSVGCLLGAAFYRWGAGGILMIPPAAAMILLAEGSVGAPANLPMLASRLRVDLAVYPALALGVALLTFLVATGLTWTLIRDMPLRNRLA